MSESRIKVLVAEDEVHLGQILSNFLTGRGYAVQTVTDGRAALEALRAEAYDVALLDIVMPELDGLEVLKQVRADADPPEVIIITGNGTIETAISAMKLGAYDYMAKPYRMAEIDVLVRRAWEKRRLARENVLLQSQLVLFLRWHEHAVVQQLRGCSSRPRQRCRAAQPATRRCRRHRRWAEGGRGPRAEGQRGWRGPTYGWTGRLVLLPVGPLGHRWHPPPVPR